MSDAADTVAAMCAAHASVKTEGRFPAGTVFGEWRLTAFIGRGGNGEVYCAEHGALGTAAAVKVLVRGEARAKARFEREARLLSELKSKSFPQFYSYGEAHGCQYLAMELLEPGELPTDDRAVARFLLQVCDAVAELHSRGIVHRDIKPGNILWRTGYVPSVCRTAVGRDHRARRIGRAVAPRPPVPVLADLGLAKFADGAQPDSSSFSIFNSQFSTRSGVGTPGYGAPEQMERGEVTVSSDIHALGVLADRCFGGRPPRRWARIIRRATSSIPAHRYPSVAAFARAIRWRRLDVWLISVAALLLAAGAVLTAIRPATTVEPAAARQTAPASKPFPAVLRLKGKTVVMSEPVILEAGREYRVSGPGTLDADLFCPTTAVVRLKDCVVLNRTKRLYPENGIQYRLENGVYLNFIDIRKKPPELRVRDFTGIYDGAFNYIRFGGPATAQELMDQIHEERQKELLEMKP